MSINFQVSKNYKARSYHECGYNFPEGEYKLKIIHDGFPENPVNHKNELVVSEEALTGKFRRS